MKRKISFVAGIALLTLTGCVFALAQEPKPSPTPQPPPRPLECTVTVYKSTEVDRKVKILSHPNPQFEPREIEAHQRAVIVLRAIFCGSGKVTDVRIQKSVSRSLNEEAIRTAKTITFRAAEKSGEKVSQWLTLEYHIN